MDGHDLFTRSASPIGVHARLWAPDWAPESARSAVVGAAAAGFDLIEIPAEAPTASTVLLTTDLLEEHELGSVVSLALQRDQDITSTDPDVVARGETVLLNAARFARDIGATYVGGVLYSQMGKYAEASDEAGRQRSLSVLRRVADFARASGIRLGLEYVNRYESNLLNTAAQTVAFIEELGAENVSLHLDTYHANVEEVGQGAAVRAAGARLAYVHAAENHRGALGTGSIDWADLFIALLETGFTGPITVESFSPAVVTQTMADDIGLWRELWSDPAQLAAQSRAFIAAQFAAAQSLLAPA